MEGTWQTTGGSGPAAGLVAVAITTAVIATAVVAWIITNRLLIVLILVALLVIAVLLVLVIRRIRHPEGAVQLARPAAALSADAGRPAVEAQPAPGIHYHGGTHLHIEAGADAAAILRQADLLPTPAQDYPPVDS